MSDYDYNVVESFTAESMIEPEGLTLGDANDEGWQRLRFKAKTGLNEPQTKTISSSIRVNFPLFEGGSMDHLTDNKRLAVNIAKRQFTDLQVATGILRVAKDEKGKAIVKDGKVSLVGTPLTAETISRLAGRYLKVKVGPSSLNPDQYDYKGFYPPSNGHQNPTDDTPF